MSKVPVIVMSGFLGSGKTTLLIQMLKEAPKFSLTPAVLMNELGKQDVDGNLLQQASPQLNLTKLLDGCICCTKKSDIGASISKLLLRKPDVILIELTGVANPEEIVDAMTDPSMLPHVYLHQVITVLDAENVLEYNSIFASDRELVHTLRRQMEVADLLILNKADLVTAKQLESIERKIRKYNQQSSLMRTTYSKIDLNVVWGDIKPIEPRSAAPLSFNKGMKMQAVKAKPSTSEAVNQPTSFSRIQSISIPIADDAVITQKMIERFLANRGTALLRAKGYLLLGAGRSPFLMQFAGKRTSWQPAAFQGTPYLVFIGLDLDVRKLEQDWKRHFSEA